MWFLCACWCFFFFFITINESRQLKYLEFLTRADERPRVESKFDSADTFSSSNQNPGDIVYKILGITPAADSRIVLNKKLSSSKRYDSQDTIFEEDDGNDGVGDRNEDIDNLKLLLEQEDNRGRKAQNMLRQKMKRIGNSSKQLLLSKRLLRSNKDCSDDNISLRSGGGGLSDSLSELSLRSSASLRNSVTDIRGIFKKGIPVASSTTKRSTDGVGMAALLVRSMMAAPSLDCISEATHDGSPLSSSPLEHPKSESLINLRGPKAAAAAASKNYLLVPPAAGELKAASDSNVSSTMSLSSCTLSSTSDQEEDADEDEEEEEEEESESETAAVPHHNILLVDADTVSMVVKSVLAQEQCETDQNDWIDPALCASSSSSAEDDGSNCIAAAAAAAGIGAIVQTDAEHDKLIQDMIDDSCKTIRTGSSRISKDSKGHVSNVKIVEMLSNPDELEMFLRRPATDVDAENWIQPGSTTNDEPECYEHRSRGSLFHDIKENLTEKMHHLQDHMHLPNHHHHPHPHPHHQADEITHHKHGGLLSTAMDNILLEQAKMLGATPYNVPVDSVRYEDFSRRGSIESLRKRLTSFYHKRAGGHAAESSTTAADTKGMVGDAMRTMLIDAANINEELVVHPMQQQEDLDNSLPFLANLNPSEPSDLAKNSYGSAVDISELHEASRPFISLTDLAHITPAESCPIIITTASTTPKMSPFTFVQNPRIQLTDSTPPPLANDLMPTDETKTIRSSADKKINLKSTTTTPTTSTSTTTSCCDSSISTNKAFLLAPNPFPVNRSEMTHHQQMATPPAAKAISGHTRAESAGSKMTQQQSSSPSKPSTSTSAAASEAKAMSTSSGAASGGIATPSTSKDKDVCRRSSDSDLSVTPKGTFFSTDLFFFF